MIGTLGARLPDAGLSMKPGSRHTARWLTRLALVRVLELGGNRLSGPIPPEIGNLSVNELSGPIPPEIANLAALEYLNLGQNSGLCTPDDSRLLAWLAALNYVQPPPRCAGGG